MCTYAAAHGARPDIEDSHSASDRGAMCVVGPIRAEGRDRVRCHLRARRRETDGAFRAALSEPTRVLLTLGGVQLTLGEGFGNPRRRLSSQRGEGDRVGYSIW